MERLILIQAVSVGGWIQKAQVKLCLLMDEGSILHTTKVHMMAILTGETATQKVVQKEV